MHLTVCFAGVQKSYFLDLRIKSYGCLKFLGEIWAGRACAGANEEELTTCAKLWGQEVGGKKEAIMRNPHRRGRRRVTAG
jgi:hypothetical protein